ncbi:exodeoxyribonuclease VII large subunit, partial [Deinococcus sp.]|uniref:exodeoxyribonuclease VII large subunit n=1 Tax=Deinococcus sp. TaxID=47478 RepID=UPI0025DEA96A
ASLLRAVAEARAAHDELGADALVIIRGGGASLDLAWLNSEALARAVAAFPAPVITGIGHARDDTILDELACLRTDTPSKAAAYIVGSILEAVQGTVQTYSAVRSYAADALRQAESGSERLNERLRRAAQTRLSSETARLDATMRQVLGLTPERTLARGYALVRRTGSDGRGAVITRAAQLSPGEALRLSFQDGEVDVSVMS